MAAVKARPLKVQKTAHLASAGGAIANGGLQHCDAVQAVIAAPPNSHPAAVTPMDMQGPSAGTAAAYTCSSAASLTAPAASAPGAATSFKPVVGAAVNAPIIQKA